MAYELAAAYVTIIPSLKGVKKELESQFADVDFSGVENNIVGSFGGGFAKLGQIGIGAIAGIGTAVAGLALSGGISRSLKIDEAQMKFDALGMDAAAAMQSCSEAVSGTKFGLDSAATVAAQFGAAGVKAGEEMTQGLKAVTGIATLAGTSMEDVGNIFAKVASKGKLSGDELLSLNERGVAATQAVLDYLNVSQEELSKMMKAGEVDFQVFSDAMYATFGEAAFKANDTFSGAMANVKAALSRVGQKFADPALDKLREVFVAAIPAIDKISKTLDPFVGQFKDFCDYAASIAVSSIEAFTGTLEKGGSIVDGVKAAIRELPEDIQNVLKVLGALGSVSVFSFLYQQAQPFVKMFTDMGKGFINTPKLIGTLSSELKVAGEAFGYVRGGAASTSEAISYVTKETKFLSGALSAIKGIGITAAVGLAVAAIGGLVTIIGDAIDRSNKYEAATSGLKSTLDNIKSSYDNAISSVGNYGGSLNNCSDLIDKCVESQSKLAQSMNDTWADYGTNTALVDHYVGVIDKLTSKNNLNAAEQAELTAAVEEFNELTGAAVEITNAQTGELSKQKDELHKLAEAYKEEALAEAAREMYKENTKQLIQDEIALREAINEKTAAELVYADALESGNETYIQSAAESLRIADDNVKKMQELRDASFETGEAILEFANQSEESVNAFNEALSAAEISIEDFGSLSDNQLAALKDNFHGSLTDIAQTCVDQGIQIPQGLADSIRDNMGVAKDAQDDMFTELIIDMANGDLQKAGKALGHEIPDSIAEGFNENASAPVEAVESAVSESQKAMEPLPESAQDTGSQTSSNLASGILSKVSDIVSAVTTIKTSAVNGISGIRDQMGVEGTSAAQSFANSMAGFSATYAGAALGSSAKSGADSVSFASVGENYSYSLANNFLTGVVYAQAYALGIAAKMATKAALGIASPSKVGKDIGQNYAKSIGLGIEKDKSSVYKTSFELGSQAALGAARGFDHASTMAVFELSTNDPIIESSNPKYDSANIFGSNQVQTTKSNNDIQELIAALGSTDRQINLYMNSQLVASEVAPYIDQKLQLIQARRR